jgi:hypothetical protein
MMLPFEWLACAWFAGLLVAAPWAEVPRRRRLLVMLGCGAIALLIGTGASRSSDTVRLWQPHAYLVLGYWVPALLVPMSATAGPTRFERWLVRTDAVVRPRLPPVPSGVVPLLELSYLVCYPLVPAALAIIRVTGDIEDASRFWIAVLSAGYACYGSLPWLVSRPPRLAAQSVVVPQPLGAGMNALVLGRVSHQLNTFPSGHVAVSCAAAGVLLGVSPAGGIVVSVIAAAIAVGAAAGRYHYVIDVALGVVVGALALTLAAAVH